MSRLRLMSQNQWNMWKNLPAWEPLGLDCGPEHRMKGHVQVLRELMPDVVGGQEVNTEMQKFLKFHCMDEGLPYAQIWGNYTPLIYRSDKLELLDTEYLLYPKYVEGYEGHFNDVDSKSCNLGVFRSKEDGKVFVFAGTHLWPAAEQDRSGSDEVRALQIGMAIDLIRKYQKKYGNCPAILGGDMNTGYHSQAIEYALGKGGFQHAHDVAVEYAHPGEGYNSCGPNAPGTEWCGGPFEKAIDHILVSDLPEGSVKRFDRYTPEYYLLLSDHAPVWVDIEL